MLKNIFWYKNLNGEVMIYTSGIKEPNGHNVFNSLLEKTEVFFKWVFLDQPK